MAANLENNFGAIVIILGVIILLVGIIFYFGGKLFNLGKLPGDIIIKKPNFSFYFPITSAIIISILITLIFLIIKLIANNR